MPRFDPLESRLCSLISQTRAKVAIFSARFIVSRECDGASESQSNREDPFALCAVICAAICRGSADPVASVTDNLPGAFNYLFVVAVTASGWFGSPCAGLIQ